MNDPGERLRWVIAIESLQVGLMMTMQLNDDERSKFRNILKERFPELGTDEPMSGADTIASLVELYHLLTRAPHETEVNATANLEGRDDLARTTSVKLARLWIGLEEMKAQIDNQIVPLGFHLGFDDLELMIALEALSEKIEQHFDKFNLVMNEAEN